MANLPIPDFGLTTAETPRSSVSGDIFRTAPQQSIAPGLAALGEGVDALAVKAAESQARQDLQKAVTRDADGNVQVATPENNFILGRAGEAYQRTFEHGSLSALQNQNAQALTELRQQFPLDPQGFKVAAAKYTEGLRSKFPGALGEAAYVNASHLTTQHYDGLVNAKAAQDVQNSFQEITTRIQGLKNDMLQMARQDGVETEAFGNSAGMLKAQYDALVANPRFGFTKQKAEYEIDNFRKEAADQFVIGKVRQVRDKEGTDAARAWAEREIRDKKGGVPQENDARFNMALGEIGRLTDQQRANAAAANDDASKIVNLFHAGKPPSDDQIDAAIENSKRNFDASGAMALENARQAYKRGIAPTMGVSAQGMAAAGIGPVSWQTVHGAIIKQESGGNPLAPKSVTGATGIGQIQPETFKQYAKPGERIDNPADNLAVSQRIVQDLYQKAGGDPARVAVGYFSGPGNIAPLGAPTPYKEDRADPTGKTTSSYVADVVKRLGGTMTVSGSSPIRFTAPELAGHPGLAGAAASQYLSDQKLMSHVVNQQVEAIGGMVKMGILAPDAVQIASIQQIAAQHPSLAPKVQELEATISAAKTLQANAASPSPVSGEQIVEQARQIAAKSPSIAGYQFVQSLQEQANAQAKQIRDDPRAYGARVGWNAPAAPFSQLSSPDQIGPALEQRRTAAAQIASRIGGAPADYMFTGSDVGDIHNMLAGSDGATATKILGALAGGLKPDEMVALGGDKNFTAAVAGLMRSGDPQKMGAAFSFMDGQWRKNPVAFEKEYGSDVVTKMHVWQDKIAFMNPEAAMKEIMRSDDPAAVRAKDSLRADADKALTNMTTDQAAKVFGSWVPFMSPGAPVSDSAANGAAALRDDYRQLYRDYFAESNGDKSIAEKRSIERMQQKWGASKLNDGRLMAYPPEKYYPKDLNGQQDYFKDQLRADIAKFAGETGIEIATENGPVTIAMTDAQQRSAAIASGNYAIVADQSTMADIADRRLPSYRVVVQDKTGRWNALEQSPGQFMRFRADPNAVIAPQRTAMEAENRFWTQTAIAQEKWENDTQAERRARRRKMREEN